MIEINLLPPEYQRGRMPTIDRILIWILSGLIIVSLFGIAIGLNRKVKAYEAIIKKFDVQIAPYRIQYEEIKISENKLKDIEERLPIIKRLVGDRVLWADKLTAIYENIPKGVWLQELQIGPADGFSSAVFYQDKTKKVKGAEQDTLYQSGKNTQKETQVKGDEVKKLPVVRISGLAKSFVELSQFIRNLDSSPLFSEPRFISANDTAFAYTSLVSFEIQAKVVTSPHQAPPTK